MSASVATTAVETTQAVSQETTTTAAAIEQTGALNGHKVTDQTGKASCCSGCCSALGGLIAKILLAVLFVVSFGTFFGIASAKERWSAKKVEQVNAGEESSTTSATAEVARETISGTAEGGVNPSEAAG